MKKNRALKDIFAFALVALPWALWVPTLSAQTESAEWVYPECPSPATPKDHPPGVCLPYPQPHVAPSCVTTSREAGGSYRSTVVTGEGIFPPKDPFNYKTFPGSNFLPNVWENLRDVHGKEMANTLPSDPNTPYRLHGPPEVSLINPRSPTEDLNDIFDRIQAMAAYIMALEEEIGEGAEEKIGTLLDQRSSEFDDQRADKTYSLEEAKFYAQEIPKEIRTALDIIEGMPVPNRAYSGIPLLHYVGPEKVAKPTLTRDADGNVIAANVDVRQIWYDQHIESDAAYIDVTDVAYCNPLDPEHPCEWTVTYHIDVLTDGHDDFSPFSVFFDRNMVPDAECSGMTCEYGCYEGKCIEEPCSANVCGKQYPGKCTPKTHAGMDQTFFDSQEGTRNVFKIKMPPGGYLNLIYTWGWRQHPPRIQAIENALKKIKYGKSGPHEGCPASYDGKTLTEVDQAVFCRPKTDPQTGAETTSCNKIRCAPGEPRWDENGKLTSCGEDMQYAIDRLGDIAPAKRMWNDLNEALDLADAGDYPGLLELIGSKTSPPSGTWAAYFSWKDRTKLPCYEWDAQGHCIDGANPDPDSDITILYANNTIYGQLTQKFDGYTDYTDPDDPKPIEQVIRAGWVRWDEWKLRPQKLKVTALNGDHFVHSYLNVDFGGSRGWENLFKSSVKVAGSGCWFTFGRASWHINTAPAWICVPPAKQVESAADLANALGEHQIEIDYHYEPSRRLRFYQFDQFHHDVNIYSVH